MIIERKHPLEWNEHDLHLIVSQQYSESINLEFKSSIDFQAPISEQKKEKIKEMLSKEVSAFANAQGGTIIIGIAEKKEGKKKVAIQLDDGINSNDFNMEWLSNIINDNLT